MSALAVTGVGLLALTGKPRLLRVVVATTVALCLAGWVFIQDLGVLGGLGTDPNSMIPMALLVIGGYLALVRVPEPAARSETVPGAPARTRWRERIQPARLRWAVTAARARPVASLAAVGMILAGIAPAAAAQGSGSADPILARSLATANAVLDHPAGRFSLVDQSGRTVSLADLRGKVVLLAFLDPLCADACPPIAEALSAADRLLGPAARQVELVAIAANPVHYQVTYTSAFTREEHLNQVPNWLFPTGSLDQLQQLWRTYGVAVRAQSTRSPNGQSDVALITDATGLVRTQLEDDPALWTPASTASFAALLADTARRELARS